MDDKILDPVIKRIASGWPALRHAGCIPLLLRARDIAAEFGNDNFADLLIKRIHEFQTSSLEQRGREETQRGWGGRGFL